jgi:cytochrome c oxidase cbb3-type subunit 3
MKRSLHPATQVSIVLLLAFATLAACDREKRDFTTPAAPDGATMASRLTPQQPAQAQETQVAVSTKSPRPYEDQARDVSDGKRFYRWYNCNGCHGGGGGGGMGPPLMDNEWIYGREPAQIFETIARGRPNGMPSFGGHVPDDQIWKLVAYVRSMSGLLPSDVAPGRGDQLLGSVAEQRRESRGEVKVPPQ